MADPCFVGGELHRCPLGAGCGCARGTDPRRGDVRDVGVVPLDRAPTLHRLGMFLRWQVEAVRGHCTAVRGVRVQGEKALGDCRLLNCVLPEYFLT